MTIVRAVIGDVPGIAVSTREGFIAVTPTGTAGPAGPATEWRFQGGYLQARPVDLSSDWANVIAVSAITGPMPDHSWSGTQLRFETSPGVWGSYVDLKGDAVEIDVSGGFIRWRPTGGSWTNIVELTDLVGADGPAIELQKTATHVQWRVVGDPTWINLVALTDIKGDQGDPGPIGINLPLGPWNSGTAYVARDVVTLGGSSWVCLVNHTNQSPPTLPTTANTYWSLLAKIGDTPTAMDIDAVEGLNSELLGSAHSAITVAATDIVAEFVYDTTLDDDKGAWRHRCAHTSWWQEALNTGTRGSKREFPAKAKIVARAGSVTFYDLTDLDASGAARLWKQFATGGTIGSNNHNKLATAADVVGSVFALNGRLYVSFATTTNFGFTEIDFVADRATSHRGSELRRYRGGLGAAEALGSAVVGSQTILTGNAPHVHARVFPGAPVDAYGLPIPKVAVATAGGVSVMHEDGAVYDITRSAPGNSRAYFLSDGRIAAALASSAQVDILPVPYADATVAAIRQAFYSTVGANLPTLSGTTGALAAAADAVAVGNAQGLALFLPNPGAESAGMVSYAAINYATGWQVGDIRGAHLCDTTTGNIVGANVLTDDGSSAASWSASGGSVASSGGQIELTGSGAWGTATRSFTTAVGQSYVVRAKARRGTGALAAIRITSSASVVLAQVDISATSLTDVLLQFTATTTTTNFALQNGGTAGTAYVDDILIDVGVPDRSYKAKGLQVVGTLSRTAVATGNDLVALSGFSTSNYLLQPYNPDLDFGAGDFMVTGWFTVPDTANTRTIFQRGAVGAPRIEVISVSGAGLRFDVSDGTNTVTTTASAAPLTAGALTHFVAVMRSSVLELWVNGALASTASRGSVGSLSSTAAQALFGVRDTGAGLGNSLSTGTLTLFRPSATAPSAAQIARMYRDELPLFNAGAKACLGGASNAVAAMDFDSWSQRLLVGTGDGVSEFSGLARVGYFDTANTPLTNDAMKAVAAQGGYRSMAGGQQSIVVRDKVSQHDVVNAYPEQLPAAVANELAAIRSLALLGMF